MRILNMLGISLHDDLCCVAFYVPVAHNGHAALLRCNPEAKGKHPQDIA